MEGKKRLIAVILIILILIFALIHLAVGIGIIVKARPYGDVFGPERGIAAFNIVISVYGLIIGFVGLFAVLTDRTVLNKIVAFAGIVLAFFALVSLITALIINSLAINYVSSRFENRMNDYKNTQDSRNIVDKIQTTYDCCGSNTWLDWTRVGLNATAPSTNITTTSPTLFSTTTIGSMLSNTTSATGGFGFQTTSTTTQTLFGSTASTTNNPFGTNTTAGFIFGTTTKTGTVSSTTTSNGTGSNFKIFNGNLQSISDNQVSSSNIGNDVSPKSSFLQKAIRRKRQVQSDYGGIVGLPMSFAVTLPQSCCTNDLSSANSLTNLYCISNANNMTNSFHTNGCSKKLGRFAVGQTLGIAVINSFLIVLGLALIPSLIEKNPSATYKQTTVVNQSTTPYQPYTNEQYQHSAADHRAETPYNTFIPPSGTYT